MKKATVMSKYYCWRRYLNICQDSKRKEFCNTFTTDDKLPKCVSNAKKQENKYGTEWLHPFQLEATSN